MHPSMRRVPPRITAIIHDGGVGSRLCKCSCSALHHPRVERSIDLGSELAQRVAECTCWRVDERVRRRHEHMPEDGVEVEAALLAARRWPEDTHYRHPPARGVGWERGGEAHVGEVAGGPPTSAAGCAGERHQASRRGEGRGSGCLAERCTRTILRGWVGAGEGRAGGERAARGRRVPDGHASEWARLFI
eukprot:scaffold50558_cov30-Tisochrysis_lutea.AAC.2